VPSTPGGAIDSYARISADHRLLSLLEQTRKTYSGPVEVGEDLMSIDIGDKVEVHRPQN